jgi:hypothetical protein
MCSNGVDMCLNGVDMCSNGVDMCSNGVAFEAVEREGRRHRWSSPMNTGLTKEGLHEEVLDVSRSLRRYRSCRCGRRLGRGEQVLVSW